MLLFSVFSSLPAALSLCYTHTPPLHCLKHTSPVSHVLMSCKHTHTSTCVTHSLFPAFFYIYTRFTWHIYSPGLYLLHGPLHPNTFVFYHGGNFPMTSIVLMRSYVFYSLTIIFIIRCIDWSPTIHANLGSTDSVSPQHTYTNHACMTLTCIDFF